MNQDDHIINRRSMIRAASVTAGAALAGKTVFSGATAAADTAGADNPAPADPPAGRYRIDMHAHFLPPRYRESLLAHGHFLIGGYPLPEWSPEAAVSFMDDWGIQAQVLSVSDPAVAFVRGAEAHDLARYCNDYAADLIARQGDRFGALATLPMPDVAASISELHHALDVRGLDGVTLLSAYDGVYLGDPRFEPLMAELNRRKAYVFIHPASIPADAKPELPLPDFLAEFTFDTTRAAILLMTTGVLDRYPDIRFQLSHAGGTLPFLAGRLGVVSASPVGEIWPDTLPKVSLLHTEELLSRFYYDTALSSHPSAMGSALSVTDSSHIVFGSDWPFSQLTFRGSGDPAPRLQETFDTAGRLEVERNNQLRELPGLASRIS